MTQTPEKLQGLKQELEAHRASCKEKGLKGRSAGFPDDLKKKTVEVQHELADVIKKSAFLKELGLAFGVFASWEGKKPKKTTKKGSKAVKMTQVKQKTPKFPSKVKGVSEIAESAVLKRVLQKKAQMEKLLLEIEKDLDSNIKVLEKLKAQPQIKI